MANRISILVALEGADEGLKRAINSAERSLGEFGANAKTAGDKAAAGIPEPPPVAPDGTPRDNSGAVIGADGLGFARDADKHWVKIPQIGGVVIGDDVEIGANTTVDRGALEDTEIGNGVKRDNLIHVAHNCRVGEDTIMAAMAGLAGSTTVGKRVQVGGKAGFSGHLEVGDDIVISADTNVTKSIDRPGVYTAMIPLQPHADWVKNFSHLRRLDAMAERVRELEKKLAEQDKTS